MYRYSDSRNRFTGKFYVDFMSPIFLFIFIGLNVIQIKSEVNIKLSKKTVFLSLGRASGPYFLGFLRIFLLCRYTRK